MHVFWRCEPPFTTRFSRRCQRQPLLRFRHPRTARGCPTRGAPPAEHRKAAPLTYYCGVGQRSSQGDGGWCAGCGAARRVHRLERRGGHGEEREPRQDASRRRSAGQQPRRGRAQRVEPLRAGAGVCETLPPVRSPRSQLFRVEWRCREGGCIETTSGTYIVPHCQSADSCFLFLVIT